MDEPDNNPRWKNAVLVIVAIIFALLLCEAVVRLFIPQQLVFVSEKLWQPDSVLGWRHAGGISEKINTGERDVLFRTDKSGNRICKHALADKKKFLVIGDSFLEGLSIDEDSLCICSIADENNMAFINTSCSGFAPGQYYLKAKEYLQKENFEFGLVFIYTGNDVISKQDTVFHPKLPNSQTFKLSVPDDMSLASWKKNIFYPLNNMLEQKSQLYILFRRSAKRVLARLGLTPYYFPEVLKKSSAGSTIWSNTFGMVKKINLQFKKYRTPVYFILIPHILQTDSTELKSYSDMFSITENDIDITLPQKKFMTFFAENNLSLINPLQVITEANKQRPAFGKLDQHLSPYGQSVLGNYIQYRMNEITYEKAMKNIADKARHNPR